MRDGDQSFTSRGIESAEKEAGATPRGSIENIPQAEWRPVVRDVVFSCKENLGDELVSVYVRGALSCGEAPPQDDVDLIVLVRGPKKSSERDWIKPLDERLAEQYPFVEGVDISFGVVDDNGLPVNNSTQLFIKTQGACVYGPDISSRIKEFKPGPDTRHYSLMVPRVLETAKEELAGNRRTTKEVCKWISNKLLRAAYELVAEREGRVRHEVADCYEGFVRHCPEKEAEARKLRDFYLDPTNDTEGLRRTAEPFGSWLIGEIDRVFPTPPRT